ncbi:dihydropteroate synthase, partial [Pseudomonas syringae pv. tagetis]
MTSALYQSRLPCVNRVLDLAHTHVMGILNASPD